MDAYSQAILRNPSLLSAAVVMDVGCGTGILRLVGVFFCEIRLFIDMHLSINSYLYYGV